MALFPPFRLQKIAIRSANSRIGNKTKKQSDFCAMMALQFLVVLRFIPETKGCTLEELQLQLETT